MFGPSALRGTSETSLFGDGQRGGKKSQIAELRRWRRGRDAPGDGPPARAREERRGPLDTFDLRQHARGGTALSISELRPAE